MQSCWKCNQEIPKGTSNCPHCSSPVSRNGIDMMATIGPGNIPHAQIVPGVVVNERYEVLSEVGRGGMGIVYLARDRVMGHDVALKVIPQELCLDPNAVTALKRETSIALNLTHSNIVRLYTLDTWEGQAFVVMEYVGGGTLSHLRSQYGGICKFSDILPQLEQAAVALDYSHSSNPAVIHRDLKPLNILLTEDGDVKVADFGLARVMRDSATRISGHDSAGTLAYMSPEQIRGKGIGKGTDIYAFSAIIYEMLSGNPPFHTGDLRWQIMHEEVEPIEGVEGHVNEALMAGLAKEREERPETALELMELLQGKRKISRKTKPGKKNADTGKKRSPGRLAPGVIALLVTALSAAGLWLYSNGTIDPLLNRQSILQVESDPAGAVLYVDDGRVEATPASVMKLPDGTHTVRLELERYQTHVEKVFIQQGHPVEIRPRLQPEPYGDLQVNSRPPGAAVSVDGTPRGKTPATLAHLEEGMRLVELTRDGFDSWQRRVEIKPLLTASVSATLLSAYGTLAVTSEPSGARVLLNGKEIGVTPLERAKTAKGKHDLLLQMKNYGDWNEQVTVEGGEQTTVNGTLSYGLGSLSVATVPEGAFVNLEGRQVGRSPLELSDLQPGKVKLTIMKDGYKEVIREVVVDKGSRGSVSFRLEEEPVQGHLTVSTYPADAKVRILNISPQYVPGIELDAGEYHLEVSADGFKRERRWIELFAGEDIVVNFKLRKKDTSIVRRNGQFTLYANGTVVDGATGLMWAANDNGSNINWYDGKRYCENYRAGGFSDWRMPSLRELASLYDGGIREAGTSGNAGKGITLNQRSLWSDENDADEAAFFDFSHGNKNVISRYNYRTGESSSHEVRNWAFKDRPGFYRVLPVRNVK